MTAYTVHFECVSQEYKNRYFGALYCPAACYARNHHRISQVPTPMLSLVGCGLIIDAGPSRPE